MLCNAYDDMSGFSILNTRGVTPGRAAVEAWVRKTTLCWSVADAWGQVAAVAGGAVGRAGEQRHPVPARWAAGVRAGAGWEAHLFFSFSCLSFLSHCLNSNLV